MSEKIKIVCIVGPTACGKTALGVKLAKLLNGEVVSADSMQIYKDMHIASAAADESETEGIPHHLVEFLPYGSTFTAYDWLKAAREIIFDINKRGKTPIIVGGTGLYINLLVDNITLNECDADTALRTEITARFDALGGKQMLKKLAEIDPDTAKKLHENDKKRIIRAFEIYESTGITASKQNELSKGSDSPYLPVIIGINFSDRQKLYDRINLRVDKMLECGLLYEARRAYESRTDETGGAVQAIGHKEFFAYFDGSISLLEATENLKRATRRYAKRQLTWFRARNDIDWVYADSCDDVYKAAKEILKGREMI